MSISVVPESDSDEDLHSPVLEEDYIFSVPEYIYPGRLGRSEMASQQPTNLESVKGGFLDSEKSDESGSPDSFAEFIKRNLQSKILENRKHNQYLNQFEPNGEVIEILSNKVASDIANLDKEIQKQNEILLKGQSPIAIRSSVLHCLYQLDESLRELSTHYNQDYSRRKDVVKRLETWEDSKEKLKNKVAEVDEKINYNEKLNSLTEEHNKISSEIEYLESKLELLKIKRGVIKDEIKSTKSVIDSEKSGYLNSIDQINKQQLVFIRKLLQDRQVHLPEQHLAQNNIMDNLRLAIRSLSAENKFDVDYILLQLLGLLKNAKSLKNEYQISTTVNHQFIEIWNDLIEELTANERKLLASIKEGSKSKIESSLTANLKLLFDRFKQLPTGNKSQLLLLFSKTMLNEIEAISLGLKQINPSSSLLLEVENYTLNFSSDITPISKSLNSIDKLPGLPIVISGSPPTTSIINTFAAGLSIGEHGSSSSLLKFQKDPRLQDKKRD